MGRSASSLLVICVLASAPARAGSLYINGVRADGAVDIELKGVDVAIDSRGDIHVDAPGYVVDVLDDSQPEAPAEQVPNPQAVAAGRWWLVSADNQSTGQAVDVVVGGRPVATVRSGDGQLMVDLAPYLHHGSNVVDFRARAGPPPGGGALELFIGSGSVRADGTLDLDSPRITYRRRSTDDPQGGSRQFVLDVP